MRASCLSPEASPGLCQKTTGVSHNPQAWAPIRGQDVHRAKRVRNLLPRHPAQAQERWPPWQGYGEAEDAAHARLRHKKSNAAVDLGKLNQQIERLG